MAKKTAKKQTAINPFAPGEQRTFTGEHLSQISFPLGGIGTGCVGLSGRGGLIDWQIFNRPNVGPNLAKTFPVIWAKASGEEPICRVVQAPQTAPLSGYGCGDPHASGEGFPHMDSASFKGEFPFANIDFESRKLPVSVSLEAYNPFIPSDEDASGYPAAVLRYTVKNTSRKPVAVTLAWNLLNAVGAGAHDCGGGHHTIWGPPKGNAESVNKYVEKDGLRGIAMSSKRYDKDDPQFGTMMLATPNKSTTHTPYWKRSVWFGAMHDFWDHFSEKGEYPQHKYGKLSELPAADACGLGVKANLKPGQSTEMVFYITWHFPNYTKYWNMDCPPGYECCQKITRGDWKNYYASQFKDATDVALKLHRNEKKFLSRTKTFHQALFESTLPPAAIDAVSSQISILKSPTCLRLEDGTFYGFEGCCSSAGCCDGSCTHVWNYQQALAFLFPALERNMRDADYKYNMRKDGGMCFRVQLPLGTDPNEFHACADGQMGGLIKAYRDWKISGDNEWIRGLWPSLKRALEYAWVQWDPKRSGVMTGVQHNTYDIEFLGANTLCSSFYLAGLVAGAEIAEFVGDAEAAAEYRAVYEKGRRWIEENLFNGEFYIQQYDPKKAPKYQYGEGCISDQILGQQLASLAGLGDILSPRQIKRTLKSIVKYNFRKSLSDHANAQRVYALNDEAGLLLCSWPNGGRPAEPFVYSDEVWTGIEYQVAVHCIYEGLVKEGMMIVEGLRERFDGKRRNPWDEYECGHYYARAMASYGLLQASAGMTFDRSQGQLGFAPKMNAENFKTFWALGGVWGNYEQQAGKAVLTVLEGSIQLKQLDLAVLAGCDKVKIAVKGKPGAKTVAADGKGSITLPRALTLRTGQSLTLKA